MEGKNSLKDKRMSVPADLFGKGVESFFVRTSGFPESGTAKREEHGRGEQTRCRGGQL